MRRISDSSARARRSSSPGARRARARTQRWHRGRAPPRPRAPRRPQPPRRRSCNLRAENGIGAGIAYVDAHLLASAFHRQAAARGPPDSDVQRIGRAPGESVFGQVAPASSRPHGASPRWRMLSELVRPRRLFCGSKLWIGLANSSVGVRSCGRPERGSRPCRGCNAPRDFWRGGAFPDRREPSGVALGARRSSPAARSVSRARSRRTPAGRGRRQDDGAAVSRRRRACLRRRPRRRRPARGDGLQVGSTAAVRPCWREERPEVDSSVRLAPARASVLPGRWHPSA